jgi:Predicted membrane protein
MFFIQTSVNLTILMVSLRLILLGTDVTKLCEGFILFIIALVLTLYTISLYTKKALKNFSITALKKNPLLIVPCHRNPDRCITINGKPMKICSRCLSMLIGYLFIPLSFQLSLPFIIGILCQIPMITDGYTQLKKWRTSNNCLRIITGLISGFGLSICIVSSVTFLTK